MGTGNRAGDGGQTRNVTRATKKDTSRGSARPTLLKDTRETDSCRRHNRRGTPGGCGDGGIGHGGKRIRSGGTKAKGQKVSAVPGEHPVPGPCSIGCADPAKCQQVRDWPVPRDLHEMRLFVGLCSYYRRHIQGFTELAAPLYELATKGTDFE